MTADAHLNPCRNCGKPPVKSKTTNMALKLDVTTIECSYARCSVKHNVVSMHDADTAIATWNRRNTISVRQRSGTSVDRLPPDRRMPPIRNEGTGPIR